MMISPLASSKVSFISVVVTFALSLDDAVAQRGADF